VAAVGAVLLVGGLRSLAGPARSKLADALSARADLGRTFATVTVGTMVGNAVAPPLFGALIERSGLRVAFLLIATVSALAVGVTLAVLRGYGDADAAEPESEPEPEPDGA
jgi:predicted MFS family arabinose efflux permease